MQSMAYYSKESESKQQTLGHPLDSSPLLNPASAAHPSAPPITVPSYDAAVIRPSNLDFIDFHPVKNEDELDDDKRYETFDKLVDKANKWLSENPDKQTITCESVELTLSFAADLEDAAETTVWTELDKDSKSTFVRILRLWIVNKHPNARPEPQRIGYVNIVPKAHAGWGPGASFASYPDTLVMFNENLRVSPIPGRVINIETHQMKSNQEGKEPNPDVSKWKEGGGKDTLFVYVTRVFYEIGDPMFESIGSVDFFAQNSNESVTESLSSAQSWLSQQSGFRITNIQSINMKCPIEVESVDSTVSFYVEFADHKTFYTRVIRVFYTVLQNPVSDVPGGLNLKHFIPYLKEGTGGCCESNKYENTTQARERMAAWFRVAGARPLSAETISVEIPDGSREVSPSDCDKTLYVHKGGKTKDYMTVFRVYFREPFQEPPANLLPARPVVRRGDNWCIPLLCCCCYLCHECCEMTSITK